VAEKIKNNKTDIIPVQEQRAHFSAGWLILLTLILLVSACKPFSSGSNSTEAATPTNTPTTVSNQLPEANFTLTPVAGTAPLQVNFDATASTDKDGTITTYTWQFGDGTSGSGITTSHLYTVAGSYIASLVVTDNKGATDTSSQTVTVNTVKLPPDPKTTASSVKHHIAASLYDTSSFLYNSTNPVQTGISNGTIQRQRAVVLRGSVNDKNGLPLPGVNVTVLNHPEFGQTLTRADGVFDLAVNGGGALTINYSLPGYLKVQRTIQTQWNQYAWLPDIVMLQTTARSNPLSLGSSETQILQGPEVSDNRGTRHSTLVIPAGTGAQMRMPDGSLQSFSSDTLTLRATEYTVGDSGRNAMPGELPTGVAYTYAVELSVDEAEAAGAASVQFDKTLYHYVDNFLGFPVSTKVPTYSYDRQQARWIESAPGVVIKILDTTGQIAAIDIDDDGIAEDSSTLSTFGFSDAERIQLASLYTAGDTLWRVPIQHFSPTDHNFPNVPFPLSSPSVSGNNPVLNAPPADDGCPDDDGSVIDCLTQAVGEDIKIPGLNLPLHYKSDQVAGKTWSNSVSVNLTGDNIPANGDLKWLDVEIYVAGQKHRRRYTPTPNLTLNFTWNGKDAYDRPVRSAQAITVRAGYVYDASYACFGYTTGTQIQACPKSRTEPQWAVWRGFVGTEDARIRGLGGWSLAPQQTYDPASGTLTSGIGRKTRRASLQSTLKYTPVAGDGWEGFSGDGGPALDARIDSPTDVAFAPDGSFYIVDYDNERIRRVDANGIITTFAGGGAPADGLGDGDLATSAQLRQPRSVAIGPNGAVYIADTGHNRIRVVDGNGIISTFAGNGQWSFSGDNGPAVDAPVSSPNAVTVASDGTVYIADTGNYRIRAVDSQGIITTLAGQGSRGFSGDDGPAVDAMLGTVMDIALGPDKALYIAEGASINTILYGNARIRRISPEKIITTVAGNGSPDKTSDGLQATQTSLGKPFGLAVTQDKTIFVSVLRRLTGTNQWFSDIRRIAPDGRIWTLAVPSNDKYNGYQGMDIGPDGKLYVSGSDNSDNGYCHIYRFASSMPDDNMGLNQIASPDGREVYLFDEGRHVKTLNALTGAVIYSFAYDDKNQLSSITDNSGQITTIEHDNNGDPSAIINDDGRRNTVAVDAQGFLSSITTADGDNWQFTYTASGLLTQAVNPAGHVSSYNYDSDGRLIANTNPAGGGNTFSRTQIANGTKITRTTAEGVVRYYTVENNNGATIINNRTACCNGGKTFTLTENLSRLFEFDDGTQVNILEESDPRFGGQVLFDREYQISTPGGLTLKATRSVSANPPDFIDPTQNRFYETFKLWTGPTTANIFIKDFRGATGIETTTSPLGRISKITTDDQQRIIKQETTGMAAVTFAYNAANKLASIVRGSGGAARQTTFSYNADGRLSQLTDALGRAYTFSYDNSGHIINRGLPGGNDVTSTYDAVGNRTSLTTPNGSTHNFLYQPMKMLDQYNPPVVSATDGSLRFTYDLDRRLIQVDRLGGNSTYLNYDAASRLDSIVSPEGSTILSYDTITGKLKSVTTPDGSQVSYSYDGFIPVAINWSGAVSGQITHTLNNLFQLTSRNVNNSTPISFDYDNDGLLIRAGDLNLTRSSQNNSLLATDLALATDSFSYNLFGEISDYTVSYDATTLWNVTYTRDALGRIENKTETINGVTSTYAYSYDIDGRLTSVQINGSTSEIYAYDSNGNRTDITNSAGNVTAAFDAQDRLTSQGNTTFSNAATGERASRTVNALTTNYNYDTSGNLTAVTAAGKPTISYLLDALQRRVGKRVNGNLTQGFLYKDRLHPIAELDGLGNLLSRFVYASRDNVPDYMIKNGIRYRLFSDHLGSPRLVVNVADGSIVQRMDYDAFGRVLLDTNPGFQPFGFAGGLYDPDTGLVHFGSREYDPETGRWLSRDPILFKGGDINLYGYVLADPVNLIDPSGEAVSIGASLYALIGGGIELSVDSDGITLCLEVGLGVGVGASAKATSGPRPQNGNNFLIEASAGPLKTGYQLDSEGVMQLSTGLGLGGSGVKYTQQIDECGSSGKWQGAIGVDIPTDTEDIKLQGKVAGQLCHTMASW